MSEWDKGAAASSKINLRVNEINHRINFEFDFAEVVGLILNLIEDTTIFRGCVLSRIGSGMAKQPEFRSASLENTDLSNEVPLISLPITLTNNELKYTLDVYKLDSLQLPQRDFGKLGDEYHSLLYQAVNKDYIQRDPLTGSFNRNYLTAQLEEELNAARRGGYVIAVAISDLDHFKSVNDTYGHPVGDATLKAFATTTEETVSESGFVARYGGEEFVLVLPRTTADKAMSKCEEVRERCEALSIPGDAEGQMVRPTVSIGVALFPAHGGSGDELISVADKALYASKKNGRNRVTMSELSEQQRDAISSLKAIVPEAEVRKAPVSIEERAEVVSLVELGAVKGIPRKMAIEGHFLYILDSRSNQIHIYDGRKKEFVSSIGNRGEAVEELEQPVDLLVTRKRYVWVVDSTSHAVKRYGPQGKFDYFIGEKTNGGEPIAGNARGAFTLPVAIAGDGENRIYVAEEARGRVQRFDERGAFDNLEISLSSIDSSPSFANYASDIDIDRENNVFILDANNNLIYKFDKTGNHTANIGGIGQSGEPGKFRDLCSLRVDRSGQLALVLKQLFGTELEHITGDILITAERGEVGRLQFFSTNGEYITSLDFEKIYAGSRNVVPVDLAVGGRGGIYTVDLENNDILMIKLDAGGK